MYLSFRKRQFISIQKLVQSLYCHSWHIYEWNGIDILFAIEILWAKNLVAFTWILWNASRMRFWLADSQRGRCQTVTNNFTAITRLVFVSLLIFFYLYRFGKWSANCYECHFIRINLKWLKRKTNERNFIRKKWHRIIEH